MQRTFSHATGLSLLQTWNRQIRRNLSRESRPRSRLQAAVGYQARGPVVDQLTGISSTDSGGDATMIVIDP